MAQTPLPKSDRIELVQRVRDALSAEPRIQADLILRTFELPGLDLDTEWEAYDPDAEIRQQVTSADDATLLEVAAHILPGEVVVPSHPPSVRFAYLWREGHVRAFISHLADHQSFTADVVDLLRELQIDGFVAHKNIEPDHEWQVEIERALESCDAFVGLLHQGFSGSYWTQQELGWAMGRGIPVTMVSLGEDPVGFMGNRQAARGVRMDAQSVAARVVVFLSKSMEFGSQITERVLASLQNAGSFTEARNAATRLEEMGRLSPAILDGICQAYLTNNQIYPHHVAVPIIQRIFAAHNRELPTPGA